MHSLQLQSDIRYMYEQFLTAFISSVRNILNNADIELLNYRKITVGYVRVTRNGHAETQIINLDHNVQAARGGEVAEEEIANMSGWCR